MPSNKSSTSRCIRAASSGSCAVKKKPTVTFSSVSIASANDSLIAGYEDLRRRVLGVADGGKPGPGLTLLLSRGMQEWMQACTQFFQEPSDVRAEVVVVLAGMLLQRSKRMISRVLTLIRKSLLVI